MLNTNYLQSEMTTKKILLTCLNIFIIAIFIVIFSIGNCCLALETKNVDLEGLDPALNNGFMLKNVKSFREIYFTKPQTWQILPGSSVIVTFNHSTELIPARSYLLIFINGRMIKKEVLDSSSFNTKSISVPIPLVGLGNYNTIRFEVEQHYTDKCEDPLDQSLWTSIKPQSHINFVYNKVQPKVNLSKYPFPIFDPYSYSVNEINFVVPKLNKESDKSLNALGLISADIAQKIKWHKIKYNALPPGKDFNNNNTVIIGTPEENSDIIKLNKYLGNSIKTINSKHVIVDKTGKELDSNWGVIYYINNPANINNSLLVITGNSPNAVNKAAKYLSNDTLLKNLQGNVAVIKNYNPPKEASSNVAKYIYDKSLPFYKLGLADKKAERMGAPPLQYPIRIIPELSTSKDQLFLNLVYSYSPNLNTELSSLEVIFNGHSLQGVTLVNKNGEKNKTLKVNVPYQYINTFNDLRVQFHLFPEKYGYCKNDYIDKAWAVISKDSTVNLPSDAKILTPDLKLFNDVFYPYTIKQDLSNTSIIMPNKPTINDYQAMLNVISSIGTQTDSEAGINLITTLSSDISAADSTNRDLILIGSIENNSVISQLKNNLFITFDNLFNIFKPSKDKKALLAYNQNQGIIEQVKSNQNETKLITILYGKSDQAVKLASDMFINKKFISNLVHGNFYVVSPYRSKQILQDDKVQYILNISRQNVIKATVPTSSDNNSSELLYTFGIAVVIILIIVFVLKILLGLISGRKEI